jgi:hypothetical protein
MTPFAMTAHLAFNMLWLLCFLQNSRRGDAAALVCGFVATGLHQLIFHPLFVAPFIAQLLLARRFGRAGLYVVAYGLIGLFWILDPQIVISVSGAIGPTGGGVGGRFAGFAGEVYALLSGFDRSHIRLMLLIMLRLAAWQHLLLLPLVICAWPAIKQAEGITRPLLAGAALTVGAVTLLVPWQGHGWGYRYLHGFLGSFALLAGYGWNRLARVASERRAALVLTTVATLIVALPFFTLSTRAIVTPYRVASAAIEATLAEVVLVDGSGAEFVQDVVRNQTLSAQQPKVMDLQLLTANDLRNLCARYDVRLFDQRHSAWAGIPLAITPNLSGAGKVLREIDCYRPLPLWPRERSGGR